MATRHPPQQPGESDAADETEAQRDLLRLVAQTTYAVAVVSAPRVFARRWDAASARERRSAVRDVRGILTLLGRAGSDLRTAAVAPPMDINHVLMLAGELEVALGATTFHGHPSPAAVEIARELARALGVPEPQVGWDAFDIDDGP